MKVYSWGTKRRINSVSDFYKKRFGARVQKVTIDAGFTCPNRDGTIAIGGCSYCNNEAFNPGYCSPKKSISQQIAEGIEFHEKRYRRAQQYLAYFQTYSNTYANIEVLEKLWNEALADKRIAGIIIGTRPDCVDDDKLQLLSSFSKKAFVAIEYGIESVYDDSLIKMNRGHNFQQAVKCLEATRKYNIHIGTHFIFGLPGESIEKMLAAVDIISSLPIDMVKFHQLQIIKNTRWAFEYAHEPQKFNFFTLEKYCEFMSQVIVRLNPTIIIDRVAGETQPHNTVNEGWGPRYDQVLKKIETNLEALDIWQGKNYQSKSAATLINNPINLLHYGKNFCNPNQC